MLCFPYNIYSDEIPMRLEHYFKVLPLSREAIHLSFLSSFRGPFARKEVKKKKSFFAPDSLSYSMGAIDDWRAGSLESQQRERETLRSSCDQL